MRVVSDFPHETICLEHVTIPMRDGAQLAARIWMPADADQRPAPAILEYIPYRKRDLTRSRDDINHGWFAGHGYACVRVDLRGSGESDGVLRDQYLEQEQDDGEDVIAWIAQQEWCSGKVGMFGISWGGFAALQIAARRPPALATIITACSTDDLYVDNMHYMGGCLLADNLSEATTMFAYNSCPPDPALVGERWRDMWMERLEESGHWLDIWLRHQRRDDFWKPGSICEDYQSIQCPVLAVSGWADGFTNAVFRLLEHLEVPCQGLIGPWKHRYPHLAEPGPAIGFLQESRRWFDHYLKGEEQGLDDDPKLRVWLQDSMPPQTEYQDRPGRWVAEEHWPARTKKQRLHLTEVGLDTEPDPEVRHWPMRSPLTVGLFAGKWCSYAETPDLPADQRLEDGGSLIFETDDLPADIELLGLPTVRLRVASDRPQAMIAARLSDVRPDGAVSRITYGLLNLSHRHGHEEPQPMEPGTFEDVEVRLNGIAQRFPKGHRIRLSLSSSYFPLAWPSPETGALTLASDGCSLHLPVRQPRSEDADLRPMPEPEGAAPTETETLGGRKASWQVHHDLATGTSTLEVIRVDGRHRIVPIDTEVRAQTREWYSSQHDDPTTARGETRTLRTFKRGHEWEATISTKTVLTCDKHHFYLHAQLDAYEGDRRVFSDTWNEAIERDHV